MGRMSRVTDYLNGELKPYMSEPESRSEMAIRLGSKTVSVVRSVSAFIGLGGAIGTYVNGIYFLVKFGPLCLCSADLVEAISLTVKLVQSGDFFSVSWLTLSGNLAVGIYYLMAEARGRRGSNPLAVHDEHMQFRIDAVGKNDLKTLTRFCSLAVHVGYESSPVDAQRLLNLQGLQLVLAESGHSHPCFLACNRDEKLCVLILPGTNGMGDVTVDMNAFETDVEGGRGHMGIVLAARTIVTELGPCISHLAARGYKIRLAGHSLGAGVASLTSAILRTHIPTIHCYAFATPPCVDSVLASRLESCVTSVVLRDDIVCRATLGNVERLAKELSEKSTTDRVRGYLMNDAKRLKDFRRMISLRQREVGVLPQLPIVGEVQLKPSRIAAIVAWFKRHRHTTPSQPELRSREFYLPGRIVHIYSKGGQLGCGFVSRSIPTLNRIETQAEMMADHIGQNYFKALVELSAGAANADIVTFQPFTSTKVCGCCGSDFLWSSVLKGEPHSFLGRHWCRRCGAVVCGGCSKNARPIPATGQVWPVRHCDRCWMTTGIGNSKL